MIPLISGRNYVRVSRWWRKKTVTLYFASYFLFDVFSVLKHFSTEYLEKMPWTWNIQCLRTKNNQNFIVEWKKNRAFFAAFQSMLSRFKDSIKKCDSRRQIFESLTKKSSHKSTRRCCLLPENSTFWIIMNE